MGQRLQQQGGLADAGVAADQDHRAHDQSAAQDPVEFFASRGQALHRTRAVKAVDSLAAIQDVLSIHRRGNGAAVAEHEHLRADGFASVRDGLHFAHAIIERLRGLSAEQAARATLLYRREAELAPAYRTNVEDWLASRPEGAVEQNDAPDGPTTPPALT